MLILCAYIRVAPSGPPLNLSFHQLTKRSYIFAWSSPDPVKANGLIIGYRFQCFNGTSLFHDFTTNATSVSVNELSLNTSYTCSLAAFNGAGTGPSTMIVLYTDEIGGEGGGGGTAVAEGTSQWSSLTLYTIPPISVLLIMSSVIITLLAMTVCYYKQKYKKRLVSIQSSLCPLLSTTLWGITRASPILTIYCLCQHDKLL